MAEDKVCSRLAQELSRSPSAHNHGYPLTVDYPHTTTLLSHLATLEGDHSKATVSMVIIDLVSIFGSNQCKEAGLQRKRLIELTRMVIVKNFVPVKSMKAFWESPFLESVGLNVEAQNFTQSDAHVSPTEHPKNPRRCLFAVDAWDDAPAGADIPTTSDAPVAALPADAPLAVAPPALFVSVIGCLGLDPLQALDGMLACFAMHVQLCGGFFIKLLYDWTATAGVVDKIRVGGARLFSSKFKELKQENAQKDATVLYLTAAVLVKEKAFHIEDIYSTLAEDEAIAASREIDVKAESTMEVDQEVVPLMCLPNQKMAVLSACLIVGDTNVAKFIQKRFPRITKTHPEVVDLD
ncbi:hypothetical protein BGZ93_005559 [Podila epicladia]|nr:hypothetical protein BGZ93_005559 [Podila epicladia]